MAKANKIRQFKNLWMGKSVKILGSDHPHKDQCGVVYDVVYTNQGWAIMVQLNSGKMVNVFKAADLTLYHTE